MSVLYRSPLTRTILAVVGTVSGLVLLFGDEAKWRSAPSLHWLSQVPLVPLQLWGLGFLLYAALLLINERTRPVGYAIGTVLFGIFTISLLVTLDLGGDTPKNIVVVGAAINTTVFHAFSIRTAWYARLAP